MIVIVDYGMGNLASIANMLKKVGAEGIISSDSTTIAGAEKLILPGVGSFDTGMHNLSERGLVPVLNARVLKDTVPILGLCLGLQLFTERSEEGRLPGLGWIKGETVRFKVEGAHERLKIPHMGWNTIEPLRQHPLLNGLDEEPRFYFVHSYHVVCADPEDILAWTRYGYDFPSIVVRGNVVGVQFHPEKSHKFGMQLLRNFVEYDRAG